MKAIRLAVGILFAVVVSKACTLAMAEDLEQPAEASVRQADTPGHGALLSAEQEGNDNCMWPDGRSQRALSMVVPVNNQTTFASNQQESIAPSLANSQGDIVDGCCWSSFRNACPCFLYAQFDALFIQRDPRFTRQPIVVDPNTNTTFLTTSNLNFNYNHGMRPTVGMRVFERHWVEFSYFGLFGGTASATAVKPDPAAFLIFPDNLAGNVFVGMDTVQVNYSSTLQSFAVNLPCCCGCCTCGCCDGCGGGLPSCRSFTWFGGFRYLNLGERLNIAAQKMVAGQVEQGVYNIRTNNNLYGGQFGARLRRTWGRFGWEATGLAGLFGNAAQEKQSVTDFPNFALRPLVSASRSGAAFVGETNLSALYRMTNVWNLRAGYSALWLGGLALAPDQLNFNFANAAGGSQLYNGRAMFLHGVNVGLEARW